MKNLYEYINESIFDNNVEDTLIVRKMLHPAFLGEKRIQKMMTGVNKDISSIPIDGFIKSLKPLEFKPDIAFNSITIDPSVPGAPDFRFVGSILHYQPSGGEFTCHCLNSIPDLNIEIFHGADFANATNINTIENLNETVSNEVMFATGSRRYKNCEIKIDKKSNGIQVVLNGISSWSVFDGLKIDGPGKYITISCVHQGLQNYVFDGLKKLNKLWERGKKTEYYVAEEKFLAPILKYFPLTRYIDCFETYEIYKKDGESHIKMN